MLPSSNPLHQLDPLKRDQMSFQLTEDGQGAYAFVSPHFYLRGNGAKAVTEAVAASTASGTAIEVSVPLPSGQSLPEWARIVLVNHATVTCTVTVGQTVSDFIDGGSATLVAPLTSASISMADSTAQSVLLQLPYSADGPLVVTFTLGASNTTAGTVGARLYWE